MSTNLPKPIPKHSSSTTLITETRKTSSASSATKRRSPKSSVVDVTRPRRLVGSQRLKPQRVTRKLFVTLLCLVHLANLVSAASGVLVSALTPSRTILSSRLRWLAPSWAPQSTHLSPRSARAVSSRFVPYVFFLVACDWQLTTWRRKR